MQERGLSTLSIPKSNYSRTCVEDAIRVGHKKPDPESNPTPMLRYDLLQTTNFYIMVLFGIATFVLINELIVKHYKAIAKVIGKPFHAYADV